MRSYNTTRNGYGFDDSTKVRVWRKAQGAVGYDAPKDTIRFDTCGDQVRWSQYGDTESIYGWEIDHIVPVSKGGTDDVSNLQVLQWANNRLKSDGPLVCKNK
jgi:5-methylcytosine-specific restriction endonuclease McrA